MGITEAGLQSRHVLPGDRHQVRVKSQSSIGRDEKCSARQKLRFPLRLFSAPPSRHRPPSIFGSAMFIRRFMTRSETPFPAPVRRLMPHSAVTFARGLAPVHHRMAGDECSGAARRLLRSDFADPSTPNFSSSPGSKHSPSRPRRGVWSGFLALRCRTEPTDARGADDLPSRAGNHSQDDSHRGFVRTDLRISECRQPQERS